MPSPFVGMDPYLEGYLWLDVHHSLATEIRDQLSPQLRPHYVARIEIQVVVDDGPEAEVGIMYPGVKVVRAQRAAQSSPPIATNGGVAVAMPPNATPATVMVELPSPEVRLSTVEIYDTAQNQLVTSIEILSPVNKREPGLSAYREKWKRLRNAHVHLIEIDLLRRGQRAITHSKIPESLWRVSLQRAGSIRLHAWAMNLQDPLPILPIPLRKPDADVTLDLELARKNIYDRAAYDLSINYDDDPPPPALPK